MNNFFLKKAVNAVNDYLDCGVKNPQVSIIPYHQFETRFCNRSDNLFGGISAIKLQNGEIYVRDTTKEDVVHELVHLAFDHEIGVGEYLNEGVTQVAAEEIAKKMGIRIRKTYQENVRYVRNRIIPATGLSVKKFCRGYAKASDKGLYVAKTILERNGGYFNDPNEWGFVSSKRIKDNIAFVVGDYDCYTEYLYEKRVI